MNASPELDVERVVRHYLASVLRRSLPIAAVMVLLLTIVALRSPDDELTTSTTAGPVSTNPASTADGSDGSVPGGASGLSSTSGPGATPASGSSGSAPSGAAQGSAAA
ncbi:MAG: hypothetical protein WA797_12260, partial [Acidimicrobiales bacterium]